jgi:hypothetical protein
MQWPESAARKFILNLAARREIGGLRLMKTLRPLAFLILVILVAQTGCQSPKVNARRGVIDLWNGRDFTGWNHILAEPEVSREAVWSARDGVLICKGTPLGVLLTKHSFANFKLVVEYRWAPGSEPGNSGILTRINGPAQPLPRCLEVQLRHGEAGDILGLHGMPVPAGSPRYFEALNHAVAGDVRGLKKRVDAELPAGGWNRVELHAQGDTYTVWMNGVLINQATGVALGSGPIGLQSEGGEIHFRRVALTPWAD